MADYITSAEFTERFGLSAGGTEYNRVGEHVTAASRMIDSWCGRRFDADSVATARVFHPLNNYCVLIDDALEITAVKTDTGDDGSYATTWTTTDYEARPLNGVGPNRQTGWPYTELVAIENLVFPAHRRASVQVTAKWGWAAVPADVKEACYLLAHRLYYERDVPAGIVPGSAEFGGIALRDSRTVKMLLQDYKRTEPVVA